MGAQLKFYARNAIIKNLVVSGRGEYIFDSDFCYGRIKDSTFDNAVFNNCNITYTTFDNVSFEDAHFYRLITDTTNFTRCDFTEAWMNDFTFDSCIFKECDFSRCDMHNVTFKCCAFYNCDFEKAELPPFFYPYAMEGCVNVPYMPMACPEEGEFIGYKIASSVQRMPNFLNLVMPYDNQGPANVLVTLKIPADARRSSAGGRKCRCDKAEVIGLEYLPRDKAEVIGLEYLPRNLNLDVAYSKYDARFEYRIGKEISVPSFDENRWHECASGIHFFINCKEALQYYDLL